MTTQQPSENTEIPFKIMSDGNADMNFISRSIAGTLEYYRVGTVENAATTGDEVATGKAIIYCAMQAFALECALKGIYQALNQEFPRKHDLSALHANLPEEIKQKMEDRWKGWHFKEAHGTTLAEFVEQHKDDFVEWRYLNAAHLETAYLDFYAATRIANHVISSEQEANNSASAIPATGS